MQLPPTPMIVDELRTTVGPSFLIGVGVLAFYRLAVGKWSTPVAAVVALVLSLAVGNYFSNLNPGWWPTDKRITWLPWLAVAGGLAGLVHRYAGATLGGCLWAGIAAVAVVRVLPKEFLTSPGWAVPAFVLLTAAVGFGLLRLSERRPGWLAPVVLASSLMAAGAVVIHAHSKSLLDVATFGGMCLFGIAAVVLITKGDAGPMFPGAAFLLTGVSLAGYHETYSQVPWKSFLLPAVAPLFALVGLRPSVRTWQVVVPVLLALAVAVGLAVANESLAFGEDEY